MPHPTDPQAAGFVTTTARLSLVLALLGLAWSLVQAVLALLLPDVAVARLAGLPGMPGALVWALEHRLGLSLAMLLASAAFLACCWGLLRRQEWARQGFIVFLVATAVLNFAALGLIDHLFDAFQGIIPPDLLDSPDGQEMLAQLRLTRLMTWGSGVVGAVAFAALHGWVVWRLCTSVVRRQFQPGNP